MRIAVIKRIKVFRSGNWVGREIKRLEKRLIEVRRIDVMIPHTEVEGNGAHLTAVHAQGAVVFASEAEIVVHEVAAMEHQVGLILFYQAAQPVFLHGSVFTVGHNQEREIAARLERSEEHTSELQS